MLLNLENRLFFKVAEKSLKCPKFFSEKINPGYEYQLLKEVYLHLVTQLLAFELIRY